MTHTDVAGNELAIGDIVYASINAGRMANLEKRIVVGLTAKMVRLDFFDPAHRHEWSSILRYPAGVVKVTDSNTSSGPIEYEYGITNDLWDLEKDGPHRDDMTLEEAQAWIDDFVEDAPPGNRIREVFHVIRRPTGEWKKI